MAGKIPELKDLEAALNECADVESAQNAFHEYRKRGGLNDGDNAGAALRKRVRALRGSSGKALAETMEHYGKDGLTTVPADSEGGGSTRASPSLSEGTPPSPAYPEYLPMNNIQGESAILLLDHIKGLLEINNERLGKIHGILVAINRGSPKKVGSPSAEEVE